MKKYLAARRTVRCAMRNGGTIYLFKNPNPGWCWLSGHGGNLSAAEMFPTWHYHPSAGIPMAVREGDMYRAVFAALIWFMESQNSGCRFPEMGYSEPLLF